MREVTSVAWTSTRFLPQQPGCRVCRASCVDQTLCLVRASGTAPRCAGTRRCLDDGVFLSASLACRRRFARGIWLIPCNVLILFLFYGASWVFFASRCMPVACGRSPARRCLRGAGDPGRERGGTASNRCQPRAAPRPCQGHSPAQVRQRVALGRPELLREIIVNGFLKWCVKPKIAGLTCSSLFSCRPAGKPRAAFRASGWQGYGEQHPTAIGSTDDSVEISWTLFASGPHCRYGRHDDGLRLGPV